jgi:hypothetical protein
LNQWHYATEKEIILTTTNISSRNTKKTVTAQTRWNLYSTMPLRPLMKNSNKTDKEEYCLLQ